MNQLHQAWDKAADATVKSDTRQPAVSAAYERLSICVSELEQTVDWTQNRLQSILGPESAQAVDPATKREGGVQMAQAIHAQADRIYDVIVALRRFNERIEL